MNDKPQDETIKGRILGLLQKGYTRSQLINDFSFAERTVDAAIKDYKEQQGGEADEPKKGDDFDPRALVLPAKLDIKQVIVPEYLIKHLSFVNGDQRQTFVDALLVYEAARRSVMEDVLILQGLASAQAQITDTQLKVLREAKSESKEVAQAAAEEAAWRVGQQVQELVRQAATAGSPNPLATMLVQTIQPYFSQTLARMFGMFGSFVLDFVGIFENLEKALAFDSKDVQSVIEGLDTLKARFQERMTTGRTEYLPLIKGKSDDKAAEAALELFRDENKRHSYYGFFRELEDLYEILSPDPFLREFVDDYQKLADLYALLRSAYDNRGITDRELARKTAHLVQEHTQAGVIREAVSVYEVNPQALEKIAKSGQSDTVKIFNLLKSIGQKVQDEAVRAPYLFTIGERAEAIAEAFKQRQSSTQEALKQLEELIKEINEAEREQAERGISGEAFAALWILKQEGIAIAEAEKVAGEMVGILKEYPHWHTSDEQARQIRRKLYGMLEQDEVENIPETVEKIMSVIKRR